MLNQKTRQPREATVSPLSVGYWYCTLNLAVGKSSCTLPNKYLSHPAARLTYTQTFDAENRLTSITVGTQTTQYIYDGDGNMVKKIKPDGSKTIYMGGIYEVDKTSGGTVTQTRTYYPAAGAMRIGSTLCYTLKDQLGSASVVTDSSGNTVGEQRYYPFGETRVSTGTMYTDKLFTGQRDTGLGVYDYGARMYDPKLGRFLSPDTIVPGVGNPQAFNRYSYVLGNPIRYNDPTGHCAIDDSGEGLQCSQPKGQEAYMTKYIEARKIHSKFKNVAIKHIDGWNLSDLQDIYTGLTEINSNGFNGDTFGAAFGEVTFVPEKFPGNKAGDAVWQTGVIRLDTDANWITVVHEMGHILDGSLKRINGIVPLRSKTYANIFDAGSGATGYGRNNSSEDFADSFLMVIQYGSQTNKISTERIEVITALIQSYTNSDHTLSPGR